MKKLLILPVLAMALFACNVASDEDYSNMAKDTCDCVNETTKDISDRGMSIIINSDGDVAKMQQDLMEYAMDDPTSAASDGSAMQTFGTEFPACMEKLEKKYENVYSAESEEEVQEKIMEKLRALKNCSNAAKLMEVGLKMQ